jgi:hypothetical protein
VVYKTVKDAYNDEDPQGKPWPITAVFMRKILT